MSSKLRAVSLIAAALACVSISMLPGQPAPPIAPHPTPGLPPTGTRGVTRTTDVPSPIIVTRTATVESSVDFSETRAETVHRLVPVKPVIGPGTLELEAEGDFAATWDYANADAEELASLFVNATGSDCGKGSATRELPAQQLQSLLADDVIEVRVQNSYLVQPKCPVNRHTVRLQYSTLAESLEFGAVRSGATRALILTVHGGAFTPTQLIQFASSSPAFTTDSNSFYLGPGELRPVAIAFSPAAPGPVQGTLTVTAVGSGAPPLEVTLSGSGLAPADIDVQPLEMAVTESFGGESVRTLSISNRGASPFEFDLSVIPGSGPGGGEDSCGSSVAYVLDGASSRVDSIDLRSGARVSIGPPFDKPFALTLDASGRRAFVAATGGITAFDIVNGDTQFIPAIVERGAHFLVSPDSRLIYVAGPFGTEVRAIDIASGVSSVVLGGLNGIRALAMDASGRDLYMAESYRVLRFDTVTRSTVTVASGIDEPSGLALDPSRGVLYVTSRYQGRIQALSIGSGALMTLTEASVPGLAHPVLTLDGSALIVLDGTGSRLFRIDTGTGISTEIASGLPAAFDLQVRVRAACLGTFLELRPETGLVQPEGRSLIEVRLKSRGLDPGVYHARIVLREHGYAEELRSIPVALTVVSAPHLVLSGTNRVVEEGHIFTGYDHDSTGLTTHRLVLPGTPTGGGILEVITEADLSAGISAYIEGRAIFSAAGLFRERCVRTVYQTVIDDELMSHLAADGVVEVELILGGPERFPRCTVNKFTARLTYPGPVEPIDFGKVQAGQPAETSVLVRNFGNQTLAISSLGVSGPGLTVSPGSLTLDPGQSGSINVELSPAALGPTSGFLSIDSNDPETPAVSIPITAEIIAPPLAGVSPPAMEMSVPQGGEGGFTLTLGNSGGNPLDLHVRAAGDPALGGSGSCAPESLLTATLDRIDLATRGLTSIPTPFPPSQFLSAAADASGAVAFRTRGSEGGQIVMDFLDTGGGAELARTAYPWGLALSRDERTLYYSAEYGLFALDLSSLSITRVTGDISGPRSLALSPDGTIVYVTEAYTAGGTGRLSAVHLGTGAIERITTSLVDPDGIVIDPAGTMAFVAEGPRHTGTVVKVDLVSGHVSPFLAGLDGPEGLAIDFESGTAYVCEDAARRVTTASLATGESSAFVEEGCQFGLALLPAASCSGRFLSLAVPFATVLPSGSMPLHVSVSTRELTIGTYHARVLIDTNDPLHPSISVPVTLHVVGDTDGDGVFDDTDNCRTVANAVQTDADADGVGDVCDNCPQVPNPGQVDTNADGSGDACQPAVAILALIQKGNGTLEVRARLQHPLSLPVHGVVTVAPVAQAGMHLGVEAEPLTIPFEGRPPHVVALAGLDVGRTYSLRVTATDGVTLPVTAESTFVYGGESVLSFNDPPRAALSGPASRECDHQGVAIAMFSAGASSDDDSTPGTRDDIVRFDWVLDPGAATERSLGTGIGLTAAIPLGTHTIEVRVTDRIGAVTAADASVTVVDAVPPALTLAPTPGALFPPNHKLVPVALNWTAIDACDPAPAVHLESIVSSDPDDEPGGGDGATVNDIQGADWETADTSVILRAERSGARPDRSYTITLRVEDAVGHATRAAAIVTVPHDLGALPEPLRVDLATGNPGSGNPHQPSVLVSWPAVPGATGYDLLRGDLQDWRRVSSEVVLWQPTVLARGLQSAQFQDNGTSVPPPGHAWYYLVQARTVLGPTGFGSESAIWPRRADGCAGGCP